MKQDNLSRLRRSVAISYVLMFFALFTVISGIFAYWFARKVTQVDEVEVWLEAQALWIMRNIVIYMILVCCRRGFRHDCLFIPVECLAERNLPVFQK